MAILRDIESGRVFPLLSESVTVGRHAECDLQIKDNLHVSGRHAMILRAADAYYLTDLGSSNGTSVNGERITESTRLRPGDRIDLCGPTFEFVEDADPTATIAAPAFSLRDSSESGNSMVLLHSYELGAEARPEVSPEAKLRAVLEMDRNLGATLDLNEVPPKILESLFVLFPQTDRGFVLVREPDGELIPKAVRHRNSDETNRPSISRTIIDQVLQSGRAMLSANAEMDERFGPSQSVRAHGIRSIMCVPIVSSSGQAIGVIQLDTKGAKNQFRQEDLDVLLSASFQAARAMDLARLHEVRREMEAATRIQRSFLPAERPDVSGLAFFDFYAAAQDIGGDYYDYIQLPNNRLAVAVGDVAGKGVSAALLMAQLSATARFCLATEPTVSAAVNKLNAAMIRVCGHGRFATFVVGVIDLVKQSTTWVTAGHIPALLRRATGEVLAVGEASAGIPLGVLNQPYEEVSLPLEPGDSFVLCTDGVTESKNAASELYGVERLTSLLKTAPGEVAPLGLAVLTDVRRFAVGKRAHDDLTLVCFGRNKG
jgi:phosphoserine phosphatase RsbU/P